MDRGVVAGRGEEPSNSEMFGSAGVDWMCRIASVHSVTLTSSWILWFSHRVMAARSFRDWMASCGGIFDMFLSRLLIVDAVCLLSFQPQGVSDPFVTPEQ